MSNVVSYYHKSFDTILNFTKLTVLIELMDFLEALVNICFLNPATENVQ